jgi:hypothetical protein
MHNRNKLTKKYLMSLPEGVYLVSNIYPNNPMQSRFAEKVTPPNLRKDQWDRIIKADVHQRLCDIFETEDEYKKWLTDLNYNISKNKKKVAH